MDRELLLLLTPIAFAAFFLKAMTGFGPAIVIISIGSLFFPPKSMVAASAMLDLIAGVILFFVAGERGQPRFLFGLMAAMILGTILGAAALGSISPEAFRGMLGVAILILAVWFALFRARESSAPLVDELPAICKFEDVTYLFFGGFLGGLFGISGPPIIWHLGRRYQKQVFRGLLITVFAVAALARVLSYSAAGIISAEVVSFVLAAIPGQLLGLYAGSRVFFRISERRFSCIVGIILFAISLGLIF